MKRNNKKGFTIVELVIVIAVIAILAGVMIPTFGNVISNANKASAEQEARNGYTACYSRDIADGTIDGKEFDTAINDSKYTATADGYQYTATKGKWTAVYNGTSLTSTESK